MIRTSVKTALLTLLWVLSPPVGAAEPVFGDDDNVPDPLEPRYIIESIEIRNTKTSDDVIRAYLSFKVGDVLDQEAVELSRVRLIALGYFKDVRAWLEKGSIRGRVKVVLEVEERWPLIIDDLFFGFSGTNPFWGGAGLSYLNFLGRGMDLSAALVASEFQQAARLGVFWSSILGSPYSAGLEAIFAHGRESSFGDIGSDPCPFSGDQTLPYLRAGGLLSFGARLSPANSLHLGLQVEHIQADAAEPIDPNTGLKCSNYPFLGYIKNDQSTLSSLTFRYVRDTRDSHFLPSQGMNLVLSIELASKIFGSDYEYSKYTVLFEYNLRLWLDHVLRLTFEGGLIQDVGERGSPFFKRFFIGDYALFQVGKTALPRQLELNFSTFTDCGDLVATVEAEYDIPLWATGQFFYRGYAYFAINFTTLEKAAFLASEEEWSGRPKRPVSFDLGLKFETPIGLLVVSVGYLMDLVF